VTRITNLVEGLDELRVLVRNVLFHKRHRFEQLLACLAPELALVLHLHERLDCLVQLAVPLISVPHGTQPRGNILVVALAAVVRRVQGVPVEE
jgi:hypothetical protein